MLWKLIGFAFGWVLVRTGGLIAPGRLLKNKKIKITRSVRQVNVLKNQKITSQIFPKIDHKNPYFRFVQNSAQFEVGASTDLRAYSYLGAYKKFPPENWAFH